MARPAELPRGEAESPPRRRGPLLSGAGAAAAATSSEGARSLPPRRARLCVCARVCVRDRARSARMRRGGKWKWEKGGEREERGRRGGAAVAAPLPARCFPSWKRETERRRRKGRALRRAPPRRRSLIRSFGAETDVGSRHPAPPLKGAAPARTATSGGEGRRRGRWCRLPRAVGALGCRCGTGKVEGKLEGRSRVASAQFGVV